MVSLAVIAIALGGIAYWLIQGNSGADSKVSSQPKVSEKVDYTGQTIPMTDVSVKVENGKISIPARRGYGEEDGSFRIRRKRSQDSSPFLCYPELGKSSQR